MQPRPQCGGQAPAGLQLPQPQDRRHQDGDSSPGSRQGITKSDVGLKYIFYPSEKYLLRHSVSVQELLLVVLLWPGPLLLLVLLATLNMYLYTAIHTAQ